MALDRTKKHWRLPALKFAEKAKAPKKVQVMRVGTFWHPKYGKFSISRSDLAEIKTNFDRGIRGIDPAIDYAHESDKVAAAWIRSLELRDGGKSLWAEVEWTPKGKKVVEDKEYRYLSADLAFKYQDNESLEEFGTVLLGAGLTNRPVIKNMEPTTELGESDEAAVVMLSEYEGQSMAKKVTIGKTRAEQKRQLAEVEAQRKKLMKALELEEMDEESEVSGDADDDDDDDEDDGTGVDTDKASHDELKAAVGKMKKAMGKMSEKMKCMEDDAKKAKDKAELSEKEATFNKMLADGRVIEAQREPYLKGDMAKFAETWKPVNLSPRGTTGTPIPTGKDTQDEVNEKAQKLLSEGKVKSIGEGIRQVLAEEPELERKQQRETGFEPPARVGRA